MSRKSKLKEKKLVVSKIERETKTPLQQYGRWLILACIVGLILRLAFLSEVSSSPFAAPHLFDQATYVQWGEGIVKGNWDGMSKPYWQGPLYPYMIAVVFTIIGKSVLAIRIIQILIGAATIIGLFFLTRTLFGEMTALIASFIAALYRPFIFMESAILTETVLAFLNLAAVLAIIYAGTTTSNSKWPKLRWLNLKWLAAGLIIGIAAVGRGTAFMLVPLALGWLIFKQKRKNIWIPAFSLGIGLVATIAPVTVRNIMVSNEFVLLSANSGLNLFIGNHSGANGAYDLPPGLNTQADPRGDVFAQNLLHKKLTSNELSKFYRSKVKEFFKQQPRAFIALLGKKLLLFIHSSEISHDDDFDYFRRRSVVMKIPIISYGILFPLTLFGMILAFMRVLERSLIIFTAATFAVYAVFTVLFFIALRYRIPSAPLMIPFAAFTITEIWKSISKKNYRLVVQNMFFLVLLLAIVYYPYKPMKELVLLSRLQSHNQTSLAYQKIDEVQKALDELNAAIELAPQNSSLHLNMGNVLLSIGNMADAEKEYGEAIRLSPSNVNAHSNLGTVLEERGDFEGAEREYIQALSIDPDHAIAQQNLKKLQSRRQRENVQE